MDMIVIIDTNAYHGDVYASQQSLSALFEASDSGALAETEIWTPRGVVEELVRQFSERVERMEKVLGTVRRDLSSFGISRPMLPAGDEEARDAYRHQLEQRLVGPSRQIADHPADSGRIVDWAARHRYPIRPKHPPDPKKNERDLSVFVKRETLPVFGVVDAAIWLTVIEAANTGQRVVLITSNTRDFSDPQDRSRPCPSLVEDLQHAGADPSRVSIVASVLEFNKLNVTSKSGEAQAGELLADEIRMEALKTEISDAVLWFPLDAGPDWGLGVDVDEATLASFETDDVKLIRADGGPVEYFMTVWAVGTARLDLGIWKHDAVHIPDDSPITVYDWDWNESMVAAEAEVEARLLVEVRVRRKGDEDDLAISIDDVEPLG